jgi:hypothetical protein
MKTDSYNKILKYLTKHHQTIDDTFKMILIDLLNNTNFDYKIFKKILFGAHIIIKDDGKFYKKWILYHKEREGKKGIKVEPILANFSGLKTIFNQSSHNSCDNQYRLGNGIIYGLNNEITNSYDLLIGTVKNNGNMCKKYNNTWFQLEKNRITTLMSSLQHINDYLQYIIYGVNIGPFGESEHTEGNEPIILYLK